MAFIKTQAEHGLGQTKHGRFSNAKIDQPGKPIAMALHGRWGGARSRSPSPTCACSWAPIRKELGNRGPAGLQVPVRLSCRFP